ncbi:SIS domain-containing protein [Acrocarpospora macrocephala]|uniref:Phosphoheptose isomerase n=1 Tax=Acrocarpospora macrocephala TaxID=150177 RepID=A0A5M3WL23_9ACTN|nr:SIS domain-containing protein [Acrocarpospora macrocephala]GES07921.1 phosphoheptose isomerase [Acrocarpospora macrocephala]
MSEPGGLETLYPFLYAGLAEPDETQLRRSTEDKIAEIGTLRRSLAHLHGERLVACAQAMAAAIDGGARLFTFGNGGSSTDAQDIAQTFANPLAGTRPVAAISLAQDVAVLTALSNDVGYDLVFARQLAALGRRGDIAVGLSTSGGSANVLNALAEARRRGMLTVGLVGYDGGTMARDDLADHLFVVPSTSVHRIQEAQITLYHVLWELTALR